MGARYNFAAPHVIPTLSEAKGRNPGGGRPASLPSGPSPFASLRVAMKRGYSPLSSAARSIPWATRDGTKPATTVARNVTASDAAIRTTGV